MADGKTPNLDLTKPAVGVLDKTTTWGDKLNANFDKIDASVTMIIKDTYQEIVNIAIKQEGTLYYAKDQRQYYAWNAVDGLHSVFG